MNEIEETQFELYFSTIHVGTIKNAYYTDLNWYGAFEIAVDIDDGSLADRVRDYIAFSVDWHARLDAGENPDDQPWRDFDDITETGQWYTVNVGGEKHPCQPPVFWPGNEVCWRQ